MCAKWQICIIKSKAVARRCPHKILSRRRKKIEFFVKHEVYVDQVKRIFFTIKHNDIIFIITIFVWSNSSRLFAVSKWPCCQWDLKHYQPTLALQWNWGIGLKPNLLYHPVVLYTTTPYMGTVLSLVGPQYLFVWLYTCTVHHFLALFSASLKNLGLMK